MGTSAPCQQAQPSRGARVHTPSGLRGIEPPTHAIFQVRCPLCKAPFKGAAASWDTCVGTLAQGLPTSLPRPPSQPRSPEELRRAPSVASRRGKCPYSTFDSDGGSDPLGPRERGLGLQRGLQIGRQGFRGGRIRPSSPWWLLSQACPMVMGMQVCAQHLLSPWLSSWQKGDFLHVSPLIFFCTFQTCKQAERTVKSAPTTFHLDSAVVSSGPRHSPTT